MNELRTISFTSLNEIDTLILEGDENLTLNRETFILNDSLSEESHPILIENMLIMFLSEGKMSLRINLDTYHIRQQNVLVLIPNSIIEIKSYEGNVRVDFLLFKIEAVAELITSDKIANYGRYFFGNPILTTNPQEYEELNHLREQLLKKDKIKTLPFQKEIDRYMFYVFCLKILQKHHDVSFTENPKTESRDMKLYREFFILLTKYHKQERSLCFYADKLHITTKYFSRKIKEITRRKASEIIDQMVIMSAKASLKCTEQTILQISEEFCFPNPSFFGTYFKKHTGMTPLQYRKLG